MLLGRNFFLDNLVATPYHVTLWRDGNVGLSSVGANLSDLSSTEVSSEPINSRSQRANA